MSKLSRLSVLKENLSLEHSILTVNERALSLTETSQLRRSKSKIASNTSLVESVYIFNSLLSITQCIGR